MINIFCKRAFVNVNPNQEWDGKPLKRGHLMRVSSIIRGDQIAEKLGARLNPKYGYSMKDTNIYVKPHVKANEDFNFPPNSWVDIIDGWGLIPLLEKHPEVGIITISQKDYETISSILPNKVVFIPQHHVNFERLQRRSDAITKVGVVGTLKSFDHLPKDELIKGLKKRDMELVELSNFETRKGIQDFYRDLFVQIVWRPYRRRMGNPLKLVNAASFGVPTIALEEEYFKEMDGYYRPVKDIEDFFIELDNFRRFTSLYKVYSKSLIYKAEKYHIDNIAKLYQKL